MYDQYFLAIGDNQFIFSTGFCFKSFVRKQGLENQVIAFFLQHHPFFRITVFYFADQWLVKFNMIFFGKWQNKLPQLLRPFVF